MSWLTGWSYRKKITIDSAKIDAGLSDFPVKVILDEYNFDFGKALENGNDLRFTSADGETLLKYERELHDQEDKIGVYHVKVPSVSSESDTEIFVYFGKADASDGEDRVNVWDENFVLVQHMGPDLEDSTANDNDGTNSGTTLALARDGYYRSFDGTDDYITIPADSSLQVSGNFTFDFLLKRGASGGEEFLYNLGYNNANSLVVILRDGTMSMAENISGYIAYNISDAPDTTLQFMTITRVSDTYYLYLDSVASGNVEGDGVSTGLNDHHIGWARPRDKAATYFNGQVYEARQSSSARSDAWIKATYNSLADTLLTYGALEKETYSVSTAKVFVIE